MMSHQLGPIRSAPREPRLWSQSCIVTSENKTPLGEFLCRVRQSQAYRRHRGPQRRIVLVPHKRCVPVIVGAKGVGFRGSAVAHGDLDEAFQMVVWQTSTRMVSDASASPGANGYVTLNTVLVVTISNGGVARVGSAEMCETLVFLYAIFLESVLLRSFLGGYQCVCAVR